MYVKFVFNEQFQIVAGGGGGKGEKILLGVVEGKSQGKPLCMQPC